MSQPTAMKLNLPKDTDNPEEQNKAKESGTLTLLLGSNNNVFYYEGVLSPDASNFKSSSFKEIREVITNKKSWVIQNMKESDFVVVIKPSDGCTYKNVVDILDEMSINVVKKYAMVDISDVEAKLVAITEGNPAK